MIAFTKMHGAGNDYIYVDTMQYPINDPERLAIEWSKPHTGIGSDGLVLICPSKVADFKMRIFNADGSEAKMCGNASRCIGKYVYENGLTTSTKITLETLSGIKVLNLLVEDNWVKEVTVDMGSPVLGGTACLDLGNKGTVEGVIVSMGNPHFVIFVEDVEKMDIATIGPQIENHPMFPDRTNVEFVQVLSNHEVRMRVWERGSGITMACGTGACATAVACALKNKTMGKITVKMDGGDLDILWEQDSNTIFMTGKAAKVFTGYI